MAQKTVDYVHQLAADRTEYQALLQVSAVCNLAWIM